MSNPSINCVWQGEKLLFDAKDLDGHSLLMDTAEVHGGDNKGFRPMHLLLAGLAGCMGMDVKIILDKKKMDIESYSLEVEGVPKEGTKPMVYGKIIGRFYIKGRGLDEAQIKGAIELAEEKYCNVSAMLSKVSDIEFEVVLL